MSTSALTKLSEADLNKVLIKFVPKDQPSPKAYLELVQSQILGVDKKGNPRSIEDFIYFLNVAKRTGLDPLAKQLHASFRWNSRQARETMTIQTGIDGFRLIAQRSNEYAGQDDCVYHVDEVYDPISGEMKKQLVATITVYRINKRTNVKQAITASARWDEYVQYTQTGEIVSMWKRMPYNQLGKCAEALALRKGFPQELSGLYADEEMGQADNVAVITDLPKPKSIAEKEAKKELTTGATVAQATGSVVQQEKEPAKSTVSPLTKEDIRPTQPMAKSAGDLQAELLEKQQTLEGGETK